MMPAEYVRPYVKSNKNDFIDAEAIAEAVVRPSMRFVPVKTDEQLDLQALHRVRERWIQRRVALVNQIRGFLLERGIPMRVGAEHLRKNLPAVLENAGNGLTSRAPHASACTSRRMDRTGKKDLRHDGRNWPNFPIQ
jgi:transposase